MLLPNNLLQTNVEGYLPTNYDTTFYNTNESITFKKLSYEKKNRVIVIQFNKIYKNIISKTSFKVHIIRKGLRNLSR